MSSDWIRAALRSAAAGHPPNRTAVLARIERGKAALDRPRAARHGRRRTAVRTVGIAATVAAALGFSVAVTWAAVGTNALHQPPRKPIAARAPVTTSPSPTPVPVETGRAPSATHAPSSRAPAHASPSAVTSSATVGNHQGFLRSSGAVDAHSIDNWAQNNVTLATTEPVTALQVSVRVVATPYVSSTGTWSTVLAENLVTTVEQRPDALVYRFTLKPGVTLGTGSYTFAVQYNQAVGGRDPSRDTYQATATAGGTRVEVAGGF